MLCNPLLLDDQYESVGDKSDPKSTEQSSQERKRSRASKPKAGEDKEKPIITREQFYKIRPKLPRISKGDPRRS